MATLISCDPGTDKIYVHSGISETVANSFSSPYVGWPAALTYDGSNLVSGDASSDKIYVHSGVSATITDSFSTPAGVGNLAALGFDGANLISTDPSDDLIFVHDGVAEAVTDSFAANNRYGLSSDGTNLLSCDLSKIYIHSGVTSTITSSFAAPAASSKGLGFDGTNLISCDNGTDLIYKHSGVSSTITTSFSAPNSDPQGIAIEVVANQAPTAPSALQCEGETNPTEVTDLTPEFSAVYEDPDTGDIANAVEIEVGTTPGDNDLWDSGWIDISAESLVEGNRCNDQSYAGSALSLDGNTFYWKIRFRDDDNEEGAWSSVAQFTMCTPAPPPAAVGGLLSQIW